MPLRFLFAIRVATHSLSVFPAVGPEADRQCHCLVCFDVNAFFYPQPPAPIRGGLRQT